MSIDRSLKQHGGLAGTRSVLTRAERIATMTQEGKFDPSMNSPLGLPKTKVKHSKAGGKAKKEEAAEGAEGAAAAPAKGAAPAAKAAAPAAAAKAAKPAAKK